MITVVNKRTQTFNVYIGRGSKWGNPFNIGRDGTREDVIRKYEWHLFNSPELMAALPELLGKCLGCYCSPLPCHGDVLKRYAEGNITMRPVMLIIAGGRKFNDYAMLNEAFQACMADYTNKDVMIISGMAKGADTLALEIADEYGLPVLPVHAQWEVYGRAAGYRRNAEMALVATHLLAMWDGKSRGTKHMINVATNKKLVVKVIPYIEAILPPQPTRIGL